MHPTTKPEINAWWDDMPFRLRLKGYEGNCKVCWKKTDRKLMTIALEHPGRFYNFWRFEKDYEYFTPQTRNNSAAPYRFLRENRTINELIEMAKTTVFEPYQDDSVVYPDPEFDQSGGCGESCEVFTDL
jgi:hypothetical protein